MIWFISEHHQAIYDALTEPKEIKGIESESGKSEVVTKKAVNKLILAGLVTEDEGTYERTDVDTVGSYAS